jgi:threonine dehydratase
MLPLPSAFPPDAAAIDAACAAIRPWFDPSPLVALDGLWGKAEYLLPTGAFKVRGALAALQAARAAGVNRVVAASAGNHGSGLGWAAQRLQMHVTVVVPRDCPSIKREKMEALATVRVCEEPGYDAAETAARQLAAAEGVPFVSPFDDPHVMAGNGGTLARELLVQIPDLQTLVVPVGGGGLLTGALSALHHAGAPVRVVTVQSEASPAFTRSLAEQTWHATWPAAETLAEGLEGGAGATSIVAAAAYGVTPLLVSERAIADAMVDAWQRWGMTLEGSAAVVWAAWRTGMLADFEGPTVGILTGGNVAPDTLRALARAQQTCASP